MRPSIVASLVAAALVTACAGGMRQAASANWTPMLQQFPHRSQEPIAREIRYTYTNLWVLNGKPYGKPRFGADPKTLANPASAPNPAVVVASAVGKAAENYAKGSQGPGGSNAAGRLADESAVRARELAQQGRSAEAAERIQMSAAARQADIAVTQATASLQRAEATVATVAAVYGLFGNLSRMWTENTTRTLGEWVRDSTGVIGPSAPPGSVLQVDFIFVLTAQKFHKESRIDMIAHASLLDAAGTKLESRKGYQVYTYGDQPKIELPADIVPLAKGPDRFGSANQPLVAKLMKDDVFDPFLALAMSAALADLQDQVRARRR